MMTSSQIRQSFLDFFRSKGHEIVPSSPVVIPSDPTLLFANAGMNQFKEIFLGARESQWKRVANTQKCIRVSGKHNDLEEVGRDTYHHTFFEMLGNWSFGDYHKQEAIEWAWELLTKVWGIPKKRLWVTVYRNDDEAFELWKTRTDVDPTHILRFGEKDNFWEMGDTGPCGPCSEIHYDRTPEGTATADMVNAGSPDLIEIWNLVFMQNNRMSDGSLGELPAQNVDTGMGFERICSVLQGTASNYDTDIFLPLIDAVRAMCKQPYDGEQAVAMRVIADHLRAVSFALADGVTPSNEGRGYVLRRLMRRAIRYGRKVGLERPFMCELFPVLEKNMGDVFPELRQRHAEIIRGLRMEEESFAAAIDRGITLFEEVIDKLMEGNVRTFPGEQAFRLYDTYGFPYDLTVLMAGEKGFTVDKEAFDRHMNAQRERARGARKDEAFNQEMDLIAGLVARGVRSDFTGYDRMRDQGRITALFREGTAVEEIKAGETGRVLLTQTPFYAESGGQIGDQGWIHTADGGVFEVTDTQRPAEGLILHTGKVKDARLRVGDEAQTHVAEGRRQAAMRHHSATHLLNAALRAIVSHGIKQAGSYVSHERFRFDFNWPEALPMPQLVELERQVNEWILQNAPVNTHTMALKDVPGSGIIAVFDEKYGDTVRVVEIAGISRELCGGTHVARTGDIGSFRIVSESSVASGIRRIEGVAGMAAWAWSRDEHALLRHLSQSFSVTPAELDGRVAHLIERNRHLEKELKQAEAKAAAGRVNELIAQQKEVGGIPLIAGHIGEMTADIMRGLMDTLRVKVLRGVIALGSTCEGKALFMISVSDDLVKQGIHAGKLIGPVAKVADGGGGGQAARAQAGGKDASKVLDALAVLEKLLTP